MGGRGAPTFSTRRPRGRALGWLLGLAFVFALVGAPAAHGEPRWLSPSPLASLDLTHTVSELRTAFDRDGGIVTVWNDQGASGRQVVAVVRRPGEGFSTPQTISGTDTDASSPRLTIAPDGSAIAVWEAAASIRMAIRAPSATVFGPPTTISGRREDNSTESDSEPAIASDGAGNAYVIWIDSSDTSSLSGVRLRQRAANGTLGPERLISASGDDASSPTIAVGPADNPVAAWVSSTEVADQVVISRAPFSAGNRVAVSGSDEADETAGIAFRSNSAPLAFWIDAASRLRYAPAGGGGAPQTAGSSVSDPRVASDTAGNVVGVWTVQTEFADDPIQAAALPAGASGFGPASTISDPDPNPLVENDSASPALAFDARDNAFAAWTYEPVAPNLQDVRVAMRPAGGSFASPRVGFASPRTISQSPPTVDADQPALAFDPDGDGVVAWTDSKNTRVLAAGYDPVGPKLRSPSFPTQGAVGQPLSFSVSPLDVWSGVASVHWDFGDGRPGADGAQVTHSFAGAGTYLVTLTATDGIGNVSTLQQAITFTAEGRLVSPDTTAPGLDRVAIAPRVFRVGGAPTGLFARSRPPRGSAFRYRTSERSQVTIAISRFIASRQVRKECRTPSRQRGHPRRCNRFRAVATLRRTASAGANITAFSGRIGRRALKPGTYRAVLSATDAAGNRSDGQAVSFRIV